MDSKGDGREQASTKPIWPDPPGYRETVELMKKAIEARAAAAEQARADKKEAKAKKVTKAGMGVYSRRKYL
jgi:hypothetical protein